MNFISPVSKIEELWFYPIPTKPIQVEKAVRIDRTTIVLGKNGKLYHSRHVKASFMIGNGELAQSTMKALVSLGVITGKQADQHMKAARDRSETRDKKYAADALAEGAKKLGVKLTNAQQNAVEKYGTKRAPNATAI